MIPPTFTEETYPCLNKKAIGELETKLNHTVLRGRCGGCENCERYSELKAAFDLGRTETLKEVGEAIRKMIYEHNWVEEPKTMYGKLLNLADRLMK